METDAHADHIPANAIDNDGIDDLAGGTERAATGDPLGNGRKPGGDWIIKSREQTDGGRSEPARLHSAPLGQIK